jgi:DNA adenine methylase
MKPVIKWVGGKSALAPELTKLINTKTIGEHRYYEPFAGGAAIALAVKPTKCVLGDLNSELINMYEVIRDNPGDLILQLTYYETMHAENPDYVYYTIRSYDRADNWNEIDPVSKAARTIYLNKTCFNGLYRVNKQGYFNAPLGRTSSGKAPTIVDKDAILELSAYLQDYCAIRNASYLNTVADASAGDIVYLDPPYDYENEDGFTDYQKEGWNRSDLKLLHDTCVDLVNRGVKVVVSNNATTFVKDLFSKTDLFQIAEVDCRRNINCKGSKRGPVKELIIYSKNFC